MTVQRARTLTHSTQWWSKHLATGSQDSQHCFAVGHSGSGTTSRKRGNTLLQLGQPESSGPELSSTEVQTHRQISMCPHRTLGGHRLNPATHAFFEIETDKVVSSSQIEGSDKGI